MKISKEEGIVFFNNGAWEALLSEVKSIAPTKIFVLTDTNTKQYCLPSFRQKFDLTYSLHVLSIPTGEKHKNIETCTTLWKQLSDLGADRNSLMINLGGGVVTDLGGFVAATFKRGINCINIPTSLLAMVDASVGGKNGVDLGFLKNQIGVIRNPHCVIIDTGFLKTLPQEQITSGYAEMLKHGLIHSEDYWSRVKHFDLNNLDEANTLIWDSVEIKNAVVTEDPFENGARKTLNYGHTLGHAIESYFLEHLDKPSILHGEAVAVGMILATYLSSELLGFPKKKMIGITATILEHFPKNNFTIKDIESVIKLLVYDKKNRNGKVYFVLLEDIGIYKTDCEVNNGLIHEAFKFYKNF